MEAIGLNKQECIEKLSSYRDEIEVIISLFEGKSVLSGAAKKQAQKLFKTLKEKIKAEFKLRDTLRGQKQMTSVERDFYSPAIDRAYAKHIKIIKSNSTPDNRWLSELGGAQFEIQRWLDELTY